MATIKIAVRSDYNPCVVHQFDVLDKYEYHNGGWQAWNQQWDLGTFVAKQMKEARSELAIGHVRKLGTLSAPLNERRQREGWGSAWDAFPKSLTTHPGFVATKHFWEFLFASLLAQTNGLRTMIDQHQIEMWYSEELGLGSDYASVFKEKGESRSIPGITMRWPHPSALPLVALRDLSPLVLRKPEIYRDDSIE